VVPVLGHGEQEFGEAVEAAHRNCRRGRHLSLELAPGLIPPVDPGTASNRSEVKKL